MIRSNYKTEDPKWFSVHKSFHTGLVLEKAGYFDERPQLNTSVTSLIVLLSLPVLLLYSWWFLLLIPLIFIGWGSLYIHLPIRTGIQDCESARWGITYFENTLMVYIGGGGNFEGGAKCKIYNMPWALEWIRTSTLMSDNTWFNETSGNQLDWCNPSEEITGTFNWLETHKWQETHPFVDKYDNSTVNATISVVEREWRRKWFKFTSLFSVVRREINIQFDSEVGARKGSWKGGTVGCGYDLKRNETPLECLRRMEQERSF